MLNAPIYFLIVGLLSEIQDVTCKILNCSWKQDISTDGYGWGIKPISGPYNKSGTWGGIITVFLKSLSTVTTVGQKSQNTVTT